MKSRSTVRGINTRRIRRANTTGGVLAFNYRANASETGENFQHVVARVEVGSLVENVDGSFFTARNINRVDGGDQGFRTYRVDRITGEVELV